MRKSLKILLVVVMSFVLVGCIQLIRNNEFGASNLERAIANLVIMETRAVIKDNVEPEIQKALAIPIGNGLIVALSHATTTEPFVRMRTPFGFMVIPREIISEKWFIGETEMTLIGRKDDISLFQADIPQRFPYGFGDSDRLRVGDKLAMIGYPFGKAICVKQGVVALPHYSDKEDKHQILVNILTNPGDSGSPILTYQDGTLKIVGILAMVYGRDGLGSALPSNHIKKMIAEILQGGKDAS